MLRNEITQRVQSAIGRLIEEKKLPEAVREVDVEISDTKTPEHGDYACNVAMVATKKAGMPPRQIGELLRTALLDASDLFQEIEVAGPGFLNFRLKPEAISTYVQQILTLGPTNLPRAAGSESPSRKDDVREPMDSDENARWKARAREMGFGFVDLDRIQVDLNALRFVPDRVVKTHSALPVKKDGATLWVAIANPANILALDDVKVVSGCSQVIPVMAVPNAIKRAIERHYKPAAPCLNVEFVSVNPNGPITIGSGRGAAFGDTLCRVFEAAGNRVDREYYINDGVNSEQMRLFAESVRSYVRKEPLPEKGYKGEYVQDVARDLETTYGSEIAEKPLDWFRERSQELMVARQRSDLELFKVRFDRWFSEQSLHNAGKVTAALDKLKVTGSADSEPYSNEVIHEGKEDRMERKPEEQGPLWLRSTKFGDDKDRVLTRSDGRPAYIAGDVAYMEDKFQRGYDKLFLILGPDHHGYIARMNAVCQALGYDLSRFEIIIFQIVRFVKNGKPAPMRKRDGNIYELRDLIAELGSNIATNSSLEEQQRIGADVARFFYLMRSHDTHMDFDIDLATKQSDENPVFYAQYAHARICSVLAKATEAGFTLIEAPKETDVALLTNPRELALIRKILDLPFEVQRSAKDYGVHRLTTFAVELARTYHHFYDVCRVIQPDQPDLTGARVALCHAARVGLKATFDLLGVSAPERMDRE